MKKISFRVALILCVLALGSGLLAGASIAQRNEAQRQSIESQLVLEFHEYYHGVYGDDPDSTTIGHSGHIDKKVAAFEEMQNAFLGKPSAQRYSSNTELAGAQAAGESARKRVHTP